MRASLLAGSACAVALHHLLSSISSIALRGSHFNSNSLIVHRFRVASFDLARITCASPASPPLAVPAYHLTIDVACQQGTGYPGRRNQAINKVARFPGDLSARTGWHPPRPPLSPSALLSQSYISSAVSNWSALVRVGGQSLRLFGRQLALDLPHALPRRHQVSPPLSKAAITLSIRLRREVWRRERGVRQDWEEAVGAPVARGSRQAPRREAERGRRTREQMSPRKRS